MAECKMVVCEYVLSVSSEALDGRCAGPGPLNSSQSCRQRALIFGVYASQASVFTCLSSWLYKFLYIAIQVINNVRINLYSSAFLCSYTGSGNFDSFLQYTFTIRFLRILVCCPKDIKLHIMPSDLYL